MGHRLRFPSFIFSVIFLMVASGCATLSKDECLTADWQIIGYEDGLKGSSANKIGEHRESCAKHGISPDKTAYDLGYDEGVRRYCSLSLGLQSGQNGSSVLRVCPQDSDFHLGYAQGLEKYCTYDTGYEEGLKGRNYGSVCSDNNEADFLEGYDAGHYIYSLESSLRSLSSDLQSIVNAQQRNEANVENTKNRIAYDEELSSEQRRRLLERLEDYNENTVELENSHIAIKVEMEQIRRELLSIGRR